MCINRVFRFEIQPWSKDRRGVMKNIVKLLVTVLILYSGGARASGGSGSENGSLMMGLLLVFGAVIVVFQVSPFSTMRKKIFRCSLRNGSLNGWSGS